MFSTPWISRAAALLLLVAALAGAWIWVVEPIAAAYRQTDADLADGRDMLQRFERLGDARAAFEAQLKAIEERPATTAYYLEGATDALAAAALQARVTALVESSGASIVSIQTLPTAEEAGLRRVAIRLQMASEIAPLLQILHGLETGVPVLFLDAIELQSYNVTYDDPTQPAVEPQLTVGFDLYGYLPPGGA
jgi:general secretion pathway protein M